VVAFFGPRHWAFFTVLRHVWRQQRHQEDEDAVRHRAASQVPNLHFLRVQAGV